MRVLCSGKPAITPAGKIIVLWISAKIIIYWISGKIIIYWIFAKIIVYWISEAIIALRMYRSTATGLQGRAQLNKGARSKNTGTVRILSLLGNGYLYFIDNSEVWFNLF